MLLDLLKEVQTNADLKKAKILQRYFKTGKGEYGEGDKFLGISVPMQRKIAKKYSGLNLESLQKLISSKVHEHRLIALLILVEKFKKGDEDKKAEIFNFYVSNINRVNNWDLVDLSAPNIIGEFLFDKKRNLIYRFAEDGDLWKKRIAVISTFYFIRKDEFADSLRMAEILLKDKNDLIHKAVGWMLREIGKRDSDILENFLTRYGKKMPRTMLRYAIEKFSEEKRKNFLK